MGLCWDEKIHEFVDEDISLSYRNSENTDGSDKQYGPNSKPNFPVLKDRELANKNYFPPEFDKREFPEFDEQEDSE